MEKPTVEPRATEHISEMIRLISTLVEKGYAYQSDGDVFFSVEKFNGYGKLSKRNIEEMQAGARVEIDEKKEKPHGLRPLESEQAGRTLLGKPVGKGATGLAHRVLGDEPEIPGRIL